MESYDAARGMYLVGPSRPAGSLTPYSFVFSKDGPAPYEWADITVPIDVGEVAEVVDFACRLNALVVAQVPQLPIPLGITIDHRFKTSIWAEQVYSFAEGASDEHNGRAVVEPVVDSVIHANPERPGTVQVAWSAFPEDELFDSSLAPAEERFLLAIESALRMMPPDEGRNFVTAVRAALEAGDHSAGGSGSAQGCTARLFRKHFSRYF